MAKTKILIVGAGPTGLTAACQLAKFDIPFRIIDKKKSPSKHSKAIAIQPRTLELFENMGIVEDFLKKGHTITGPTFITAKGEIKPFNIITTNKELSKYSIFFLEQHITEKILIKHLKSLGHKVQWQTELINFKNTKKGITSTIQSTSKSSKTKPTATRTNPPLKQSTNSQTQIIESRYLIAADGANSTVRKQSKIKFEGGTYDQVFSLADVTITPKSTALKKAIYKRILIHFHKKGFLIFFPFKNKTHRIMTTIPTNTNPEKFTFKDLITFTEKTFPNPITINPNPIWFSNFRSHHRMVSNFQKKSIFFAGDAAHIHSPVGGQGMNTGIQDSYNLAWKLALTSKNNNTNHQASEKILETYNQERLPFAKALLKTTDATFNAAYRQTPKFKFIRKFITPIIFTIISKSTWLRKSIFARVGQLLISYKSPLSDNKFSSIIFPPFAPKPGERLPYFQNIYSKLSNHHYNLLIISKKHPTKSRHIKELKSFISENYKDLIKIHHLKPTKEIIKNLKIKSGIYLIRPDTYLALRSKTLSIKKLEKYFNSIKK